MEDHVMPFPLSQFVDPNGIEPMPTFAVYSSSSTPNGTIHDSNLATTAGFQLNTSTEGAAYTQYSGQQTISSNSYTSNWTAATPTNMSEGSFMLDVSAFGGYGPQMRHAANTIGTWQYFGNVIGWSGIRQKISFYSANNNYAIYPRGGLVAMESISSTNTATFRNIIGEPGTTEYGMSSYNERTKTLVVVHGNSSAQYRAHVWRHPKISLNSYGYKVGSLYTFLTEAKAGTNGASYYYNDFTWSTSSATSYSESLYHNRIIMGDNGVLGLARFTPSNETRYASLVLNPNGTTPTGSITELTTMSNTTSYGIEQGSYYGMRTTISWDNQWIAAYAPYYYYGSGINMFFISTADPSKAYKYQSADSTYGYNIAPLRANSFIMHRNIDANGGALFNYYLFNPSGALEFGRDAAGTVVANGGNLTANEGGYLDTGYTTTDYPSMLAMSSWVGGGR